MKTIIVAKADKYTDRLKQAGYTVEVDEMAVKAAFDKYMGSPGALRKGKYHFIDSLLHSQHIATGTSYYTARAAAILPIDGKSYGIIDHFTVTNLVSSLSTCYVNGYDVNGNTLIHKHHYPETDLLSKKRRFIEEFIMGYTIEVTRSDMANSVYWEWLYITQFKDSIPDLFSEGFAKYLSNEFNEIKK